MASPCSFQHRTDGRTRYLVDEGLRLAALEGQEIGEDFMLCYRVPIEIIERAMRQRSGQNQVSIAPQ